VYLPRRGSPSNSKTNVDIVVRHLERKIRVIRVIRVIVLLGLLGLPTEACTQSVKHILSNIVVVAHVQFGEYHNHRQQGSSQNVGYKGAKSEVILETFNRIESRKFVAKVGTSSSQHDRARDTVMTVLVRDDNQYKRGRDVRGDQGDLCTTFVAQGSRRNTALFSRQNCVHELSNMLTAPKGAQRC
jgi:hypothetical protein